MTYCINVLQQQKELTYNRTCAVVYQRTPKEALQNSQIMFPKGLTSQQHNQIWRAQKELKRGPLAIQFFYLLAVGD